MDDDRPIMTVKCHGDKMMSNTLIIDSEVVGHVPTVHEFSPE